MFQKLSNGMYLAVTAPVEEVFRNADARMYEKKIRMKYMESGKETNSKR